MSLLSPAALNAALMVTAPPQNTQPTGRDTTSTLNSQQSSFDESLGSHYLVSQPFNESSLRSSQQNGQVPSTPSSSLSNPSSQDDLGSKPRKIEDVPAVSRSGLNVLSGSSMPSGTNLYSEASAQAGHAITLKPTAAKRTADGHMKNSSPAISNSDLESGHSRTSSTASRSSQISELSHQLKTRLSYAMVKVQNGWQDCNIEELETMASQPCSPVSAAAPSQRSRRSSHSVLFRPGTSRSVLNGSPIHGDDVPGTVTRHATQNGFPHSHPSPTSNAQMSKETVQSPRTYESFWRERSGHHFYPRSPDQAPQRHQPTLAPPADIKSHEAFNAFGSSRIHAKSRSLGSPFQNPSKSHNAASAVSITPPPLSTMKPPPMRTPSQNAAMEADAVETLLFMSSPENAHPRSAAAPIPSSHLPTDRPRLNHLGQQQQSYLAPARGHRIPMSTKAKVSATTNDQSSPRKKRDTRDIDQMLDVLSSSDDDDDNSMPDTR